MTLDQLRAFVAVVEHGSIRAAARSLDLAQSGLTQQIKRLESSLGASLFARGNRGIVLTGPGETLLARSRIILGECERTEQEFQSFQGNPVGAMNVGVSSEAFARVVPPVLRAFRQRFPSFSVHLASGPSSSLLSGIREGRLDFALTLVSRKTDMTDLTSTRLTKSDPVIVCRVGHPNEKARSIKALADCEWVNTRPPGQAGLPSNRIVDLFHNAGLETPNIAVTVESLYDTLNLVSRTDLLFLSPRIALEQEGFMGALREIRIGEAIPPADLCLVQRTAVPLPPITGEFAKMLISYSRMLRKGGTAGG